MTAADLSGADCRQTGFYYVDFSFTTLANAKLNDANCSGALFTGADLSNATLSNANCAGAKFYATTMIGANLSNANCTGIMFYGANLTNASLRDTQIAGSDFYNTYGLTTEQLCSTASYKSGNLTGVGLMSVNLVGLDFGNQTITNANLAQTGLTKEQLYSTTSYKNGDLSGVSFFGNNISGWILSNQIITGANLGNGGLRKEQLYSTANYLKGNLTGVGLSYTNLTSWNFSNQTITGVSFEGATGFTKEQLYSTASYNNRNLTMISFRGNDISGWNFAGQNLSSAVLEFGNCTSCDFRNANLTKVNFWKTKMTGALFNGTDSRGASYMMFSESSQRKNFIQPDGKVLGFALGAGETMRIWDYQTYTPLSIGVQQSFSMSGNSTLRMVFEDSSWGSLMQMEGMISVTLGGTLEFVLADGVTPFSIGGRGTTFRLFDWSGASSVSGQFSQILLTGDYQGYSWDTSKLYTLGTITLVPEPGSIALAGLAGGVFAFGWVRGRRRRKSVEETIQESPEYLAAD